MKLIHIEGYLYDEGKPISFPNDESELSFIKYHYNENRNELNRIDSLEMKYPIDIKNKEEAQNNINALEAYMTFHNISANVNENDGTIEFEGMQR